MFAVGDRIPNDGLQFIKGLDPKIKVYHRRCAHGHDEADPGGNAVVKSIYNYDAFEKADYDKYYAPFDRDVEESRRRCSHAGQAVKRFLTNLWGRSDASPLLY